MTIQTKTVYFEKPGGENTDEVFRIVRERAEELGIKTIIVASTTGTTAVRAAKFFNGMKIVAVSHSTGFSQPNTQKFTEKNKKIAESQGVTVLTTTHAFAGVSRAMRNKFNTYVIGEIIANTLRIFGHGMKVVCEISLMAADSGLARTDEDIIAIAGSSEGADTAVVLQPVNSHDFFDLKVKEILCKPRL